MANALDTVVEYFKAKDWNFEVDEEKHRVKTGVSAENGEWQFFVSASDENNMCFVLAVFPQKCPPKRQRACAELLTRINYGLLLGCFEMNYDSGSIAFKTSYPFTAGLIDPERVKEVIEFNIAFMDRFLPAIMAVIYTGISPKRAYAMVDLDNEEKTKKKPKKTEVHHRFLNN